MRLLMFSLCVLFLLATQIACAQGTSSYHVLGDVKGLPEGSKIYLINGGQLRVIDSATVQQTRFVLTGHLAEPAHMYLHAGKGRTSTKLADILLDNRTVYVKGERPEYNSIAVTGSDIDQHWKDWYKDDTVLGASATNSGW